MSGKSALARALMKKKKSLLQQKASKPLSPALVNESDDDGQGVDASSNSVEAKTTRPKKSQVRVKRARESKADIDETSESESHTVARKVSKRKRAEPIPRAAGSKAHDYIQIQTLTRRGRNNMAKPSILVRLNEEDFAEQFQNLFEEHVEGFTGLRGAKRERTTKERNMEWRLRVEAKKQQEKGSSTGISKEDAARKKAFEKAQQEKVRQAAIERYRALKKRQHK
mmetsp:Transcript_3083/g.5054  ORF Transcript_3083/g.5054 Transcript_3083/m.5054 type:complete len:225 (-) Transcript_3083:581-1255(-)|eukprot:CAMPEP_0171521072 /NCGR_PEP_ID=MMETSP0959-20130129/6910_1 /TAXON_ID=87120 /ORGANISM="Aurantiochytrium limacinum, Strain ATCCMYA-1381" /LENGTH=224 /DNA_ID=CAMNT_0012060895 /DNA_START=56 /DNA_END=730 /DNA_ORIENTATION=-